jgi:dipeptidyl aminopeptidase/acylaminoacyl peptidase
MKRLMLAVVVATTSVAVAATVQDSRTTRQQAAAVSIPDLLSAPFPMNLTAAPSGGAVAWVFNDRGSRNVWIATPPDYRGRPLTTYTGDDGQEIADLSWSPDARTILYVRGGGANRQGEYPNPVSDPDGVEQAIWAVGLDGGAPRKLAAGAAPSISPKGNRVAYVLRNQAWWVDLSDGAKPERFLEGRGQAGSLRWSPDGSKIAFVSGRGDHAFVGVYDVEKNGVSWIDPGVDRDGSPEWSPDGTRVAIIRNPAFRNALGFSPRRSAEPWSIRVADLRPAKPEAPGLRPAEAVASAAQAGISGREIFRAEAGRGSVFQRVNGDNAILWAAGDRLVFPWERDGWLHLYSIRAGGGAPTLLTPGAFEVEDVVLSPDGSRVIYSSNQEAGDAADLDRRHLWAVPVVGGTPTALTSGAGIEWSPRPLGDGKVVAFLASNAVRPAHPGLRLASGEMRELAPGSIPSTYPSSRLVTPQPVVFAGADGLSIRGQLFLPRGASGKRPAAIFFHGGSRRQMLLGWHYLDYYHKTYALNQHLASRGFVVLSVNYRSGTGYGLEFREALNYGATGASEFNDVLGAGLYLRARSDVDPARVGLWGGSYGGYLTALGLSRASDLFAAGVDIHGVHDWNVVMRNFVETYDPRTRQDAARLAYDSSPMASLDGWRSPVLLIHGDDDRNVPFSETVTLAEELRKRGVEFEQLIFPDEIHGFLLHRRWIQALEASADFLQRKLGVKPAGTTSSNR